MPDAEIIPIGASGRPGRGSGRSPSAASRGLAASKPRQTRKRAESPAGEQQPADAEAKPAQTTAAQTAAQTTARKSAAKASSRKVAAAGTTRKVGSATTARPAGTRPRRAATAKAGPPPAAAARPVTEVPPSAPEQESDSLSALEPEPTQHGPAGQLAAVLAELALHAFGPGAEDTAAEALAFLRRRITGDYDVDLFGFDRELTETVLMPVLRPLYKRWFRVEVRGIDNVPATGGALIVANHSGTIPIDSLMTQVALLDEHPARRNLRMLGADLVYKMPVVGQMARKSGATLACNEDAERLLSSGELVGVWPEGFKGVGKPFSERYKLQRFGRGGFVAAAMRTGAPIIPVSIVGAEEIYPLIGNLPTLARLIGVPYVPITPTFPWLGPLGLVPLPSKWIIEFGEPIRTDDHGDGAADDPMLVFNITDQVRETIQHSLYTLLMQRRSVFF